MGGVAAALLGFALQGLASEMPEPVGLDEPQAQQTLAVEADAEPAEALAEESAVAEADAEPAEALAEEAAVAEADAEPAEALAEETAVAEADASDPDATAETDEAPAVAADEEPSATEAPVAEVSEAPGPSEVADPELVEEVVATALEAGGWPEAITSDGFHLIGAGSTGDEWDLKEYSGSEAVVHVPKAHNGKAVVGFAGSYVFPATAKNVYIPASIVSFAGADHLFANMQPGSTIIVANDAQKAYLTGAADPAVYNYLFGNEPYDPTGSKTPVVVTEAELAAEPGAPSEYFSKHPFSDITDPYAWYVKEGWIDAVVDKGLMYGYSDGTNRFGPEDNITRGQFCTILFRYANPDSKATTDPSQYGTSSVFEDVKPGQFYTAAIDWCYENQIVTGYGNADGTYTHFGPDDPITREQLATMISRFVAPNGGVTDAMVDVVLAKPDGSEISTFARYPMAWCYDMGFITGHADTGKLDPKGNATRAQMAKVVTLVTDYADTVFGG